MRIDFFGDEVERIVELDPLTGELLGEHEVDIYRPTLGDVRRQARRGASRHRGRDEEAGGLVHLPGPFSRSAASQGGTHKYDLESMRTAGYCSGIENYSRHLARRAAGSTPWTLLDYFPDDYLLFIDESHLTGAAGPWHVFRRLSPASRHSSISASDCLRALDNRPLNFEEFENHINQVVYVSATPGPYEYQVSQQVVEQEYIRPTN